jgi:orotidine-5'-phosphate decarboxylase
MKNFADRLQAAINKTNNPTVMGLDPNLEYLPPALLENFTAICSDQIQAAGLALAEFNRRLLDAVTGIIPAVKLQAAFYEQYGLPGLKALQQSIEYARDKGFIVILDGKRNDIGSTAAAYARAYLGKTSYSEQLEQAAFAADALTVNAYLGSDGITPFLEQCARRGRGVFVLVKTSNPSAGELQDLVLQDGRHVYEAMADLVSGWGKELVGKNGFSSLGAVVGATWPKEAAGLRLRMPNTFILVPGYGVQGATAKDAVASFTKEGQGGIVNASRSLMLAFKKHGLEHDLFDLAARKEALAMRKDLQEALAGHKSAYA